MTLKTIATVDASGFVGTPLVSGLLRASRNLTKVVSSSSRAEATRAMSPDNVEMIRGDFRGFQQPAPFERGLSRYIVCCRSECPGRPGKVGL